MSYLAFPYRIGPAGLDPVDLALAPYRRGTYYDVASQRMMPTSTLLYPPSPPLQPATAARARASWRRRPRPRVTMSNKRARIPASSKAIQGLKEVQLTTGTKHGDDDDDCAICLKALAAHPAADQYKEEQEQEPAAAASRSEADVEAAAMTRLRAMPCSHIFHEHCIFQWLHCNAVCPLCRHQLPTSDDEDDDDEDDLDFWFQSVPYPEGWEEEEEEERRQRRRERRMQRERQRDHH